jgi:chromosomal replication initiator protein
VEKLWILNEISPACRMNMWKQVLTRLEQSIDRTDYVQWFAPTRFLAQKGETVDVSVPSQRFIDEIRERYGQQIRSILGDISPERIQVHFVVDPETSIDDVPLAVAAPPKDDLPVAVFNPRYRFETFVVGKSNELAWSASRSIADNPSGSFNPLFIYGGAGLGKTHLIQAIGHQIREAKPSMRVVYMSADSFVTELIASIRYDRMQSFRDRYRSVDALLLDDIQFLAGKERTQEEFFHTFNALYEAQKQIVFTSDAPPKDIPTLEERLRSRFEWGLIADIQPPDLETKTAILKRKAETEGVFLPDNVAIYIAGKIKSNIRELEGSLIRLIAYASLTRSEITLPLAQDVLRNVLQNDDRAVTIEIVQKAVADHYSLKVAELKSKNNSKSVAMPRQIAMYLCKALTNASLPEIGKSFGGKHHSTVIHSIRKVEDLRQKNGDFNTVINTLMESLK